ncbi:MAG: hypothetical protein J0L86_16855 [Flavobacteriales bacterium]|nr:hypothetical protein [Flavobacteriales bacterium]
MQSFTIVALGCTFKLLIGPDASMYFMSSSDKIVEFSIKFFNIYFFADYSPGERMFLLGINFIHLILFVYFYYEARKITSSND